MQAKFTLPSPAFNFAGFTFPKWVFTLPEGGLKDRIEKSRKRFAGPSYHAPKPNEDGIGFYLESDGAPKLRWKWADDVVNLRYSGYYADRDGEGETIKGVVFRLPRSRGFLAGYSMGEGWASGLNEHIYATEREAAYAADRLAENVADRNRARQEEEAEE